MDKTYSQKDSVYSQKSFAYCIFGDSVTQATYVRIGWATLLKEFLEEKYRNDFINVFNLGVSSNTSEDLLRRFENESFAREPTEIVFAVGVNDSGYFGIHSKPIVEENKFASNLEKLIKKAKKFSQMFEVIKKYF